MKKMDHEQMIPIPFKQMLECLIKEYKEKGSFYGVPVYKGVNSAPIGIAAGPHTQLAQNILAGYAAGSRYFELKTVQILQGKELGIMKPCIDVESEVYNTEWSTELTIEQARDEYIKAYLLIAVVSQLFELTPLNKIHFIASVGYDLKGIQSPVVDDFLEAMKHADRTEEYQQDMKVIRDALDQGQLLLSDKQLKKLEAITSITETVTLSTMHGCKKEEIKAIALYLMKEKQLHTFIKLNPTLLGKERIEECLKEQGYDKIKVIPSIFEVDMTLEMACELIKALQKEGVKLARQFGVKLTNTLPVQNQGDRLSGEARYLSGKPLYPIAIEVAQRLSKALKEHLEVPIEISYSGGIDLTNIKGVLEAGLKPITVCSYLLKAGGYKNISKLFEKSGDYKETSVSVTKLDQLVEEAKASKSYQYKKPIAMERKAGYLALCGKCDQCSDICPNRANHTIWWQGQKKVIHLDERCNQCGACQWYCIMGHKPYEDKLTLYKDPALFEKAQGPKAYLEGESVQIEGADQLDIPEQELLQILMQEVKRGSI